MKISTPNSLIPFHNARLDILQDPGDNYNLTVSYLLEIANRAHELFAGSKVDQKRKLLSLVLSNLRLSQKKLVFIVSEPFNAILISSDHPDMRPLGESNPCCGNENPES
jgi:hypothetical protein